MLQLSFAALALESQPRSLLWAINVRALWIEAHLPITPGENFTVFQWTIVCACQVEHQHELLLVLMLMAVFYSPPQDTASGRRRRLPQENVFEGHNGSQRTERQCKCAMLQRRLTTGDHDDDDDHHHHPRL